MAANQDVNKDGVKDIAVGEPGWDDAAAKHKDVGGFVVLYGNASGNYSRSTDVLGMEAAAKLGTTVALGDVNGDGYADILIGILGKDVTVTIEGKPKVLKDAGGVTILNAMTL